MVCDSEDCVKGAKVTLHCLDCGCTETTETDFFGDFQFKYLKAGAKYEVTAEVEGYQPKTVEVTLDKAVDLGVITLEK